ncbi:flavin reductase family protein [Nonomuraea angiospora]|uniref:flavin reductase family protein n=1 Tax=Nonomuraea angiospora TaxID=46172 RepID=UPI0034379A79
MNSGDFRRCLAQFATGVTVVTYLRLGVPRGVTVNAFTSVSLDPPLVLVSMAKTARSSALLRYCDFAVNVLAADQRDLALRFAGGPASTVPVRWRDGLAAPYLEGCVATLQCRPWESHAAGDHLLHLGEVQDLTTHGGDPLIFHDGVLGGLGLGGRGPADRRTVAGDRTS